MTPKEMEYKMLHAIHQRGATTKNNIYSACCVTQDQGRKRIDNMVLTNMIKCVRFEKVDGRRCSVFALTEKGLERIGVQSAKAPTKERHTTLGQAFNGIAMRSDRPGAWDASKVQSVGLLSDRANVWK
jgi:hypothetical protein